jgi:hypothetical protein
MVPSSTLLYLTVIGIFTYVKEAESKIPAGGKKKN